MKPWAKSVWMLPAASTAVPSPEAVTMTVFSAASSLEVPVRSPRPEDDAVKFAAPEKAPTYDATVIQPGMNQRVVSHDFASGDTEVVRTGNSDLTYIHEIDLVFGSPALVDQLTDYLKK